MSSRCSSCGAPIIWTRTEGGKAMPVDFAPADRGNLMFDEDVFGETFVRVVPAEQRDDKIEANILLHMSHFATCPQAPAWRRP